MKKDNNPSSLAWKLFFVVCGLMAINSSNCSVLRNDGPLGYIIVVGFTSLTFGSIVFAITYAIQRVRLRKQ